jgi:hypothetical protein
MVGAGGCTVNCFRQLVSWICVVQADRYCSSFVFRGEKKKEAVCYEFVKAQLNQARKSRPPGAVVLVQVFVFTK